MDASTLLTRVWRAYRGKGASKTPVWGSEKANLVIDIANQKQEEWARDSKIHWSSLFEIKDVDTLDTSVFTYELDATFLRPSDYIQVEKTDGSIVEIGLIKPQKRVGNETKFYISGRNPKKLTYAGTNIDSGLNGGTIKAPAYYLPAALVNEADEVSVDDPNWLVYAVAAELSRNDASKDDQFANLLGMANDLYIKMADANQDLGFGQDFQVPYNMPQIGDYAEDDAFA